MNYGLHIIETPNGRYAFVGNVPNKLGDIVPATKGDVLGQRAWKNEAGELVTRRFPSFETREEAFDYATKKGAHISN